jgi:hypothetical protein
MWFALTNMNSVVIMVCDVGEVELATKVELDKFGSYMDRGILK